MFYYYLHAYTTYPAPGFRCINTCYNFELEVLAILYVSCKIKNTETYNFTTGDSCFASSDDCVSFI